MSYWKRRTYTKVTIKTPSYWSMSSHQWCKTFEVRCQQSEPHSHLGPNMNMNVLQKITWVSDCWKLMIFDMPID